MKCLSPWFNGVVSHQSSNMWMSSLADCGPSSAGYLDAYRPMLMWRCGCWSIRLLAPGYCGTINGDYFCYNRREEPGLSAKHTPSHHILLQEQGVYQKASASQPTPEPDIQKTFLAWTWLAFPDPGF